MLCRAGGHAAPAAARQPAAHEGVDDDDKKKLEWDEKESGNQQVRVFYSFRFVYFSSRSLWQMALTSCALLAELVRKPTVELPGGLGWTVRHGPPSPHLHQA